MLGFRALLIADHIQLIMGGPQSTVWVLVEFLVPSPGAKDIALDFDQQAFRPGFTTSILGFLIKLFKLTEL